ncbi:hypothetical protein F4808DRAFT_311546 [Astrocystis sublimbata]|nr:hypothetical protein F4808DRAFT_311546 [Astrocystis sublimbata]
MMSETKLPSRYEIRPLQIEHLDWTKALFAHSFIFGSPIWRNLYPLHRTARFYDLYKASDYMIRYQISSGLSLGIFDTEHEYRNPESAASGGRLYFDFNDVAVDEHDLLQQMDTPLVSIACAFDAFYAMDNRRLAPVTGRLPASASFHEALAQREQQKSWLPTTPGQVLQRMGTATRADAEGGGFMKAIAYHMMRSAAEKGFWRIQIQCFHDAVTAVWTNPPVPFKGCIAGEVDTYSLDEMDEDGTRRFPFRAVRQRLTKVYVTLR